ncbi:MAG: glycosyltransferase [Candidatus Cloacimonadaceae bacterium]|nr:glycosyltransferase family 4 protein [Candidatus Cloacimonadota bacterium]MDY0126953.1 glycosyltransferase [Candidatus Cloacimonadaceae bacterium]MCB5254997.1 glycosyltransferase family 4 protein [Candidatus Cloacimonadota bacterium]MCK9177582.1 glycosyltransferase family 4 protein [Candidatus Cloacimonadota bacterium]MCK9241809.1 glycosyltransferase family 4 protein [Candidatus Cloacimonadota bacterium]
MKILFLTSQIPYPPDRGDKVRTLFLLRQLASFGELTLVSLVNRYTDEKAMKVMLQEIPEARFVEHSIFRILWNMLKNIFRKLPFQVAYYQNPQLKSMLVNLLAGHDYDLVYCHLIRMVPYAELAQGAKIILDYTDCLSLEYTRRLEHLKGPLKLFYTVEAKRTSDYEIQVADRFSENWVISPVDIAHLGLKNHHRSVVMPNQVMIPESRVDHEFAWRLIFTGNMSVPHNIMAAQSVCKKIMPALIKIYPLLKFVIVGADPSAEIKALDKINNTSVLGYVDDLYHELMTSDIFIAPVYFSAGIQHKALEAMACALPVITTPDVASSLDANDEVELLVASDNYAFVQKVKQLIENPDSRAQIGKSGQALVRKKYSSEAVTKLIAERINHIMTLN